MAIRRDVGVLGGVRGFVRWSVWGDAKREGWGRPPRAYTVVGRLTRADTKRGRVLANYSYELWRVYVGESVPPLADLEREAGEISESMASRKKLVERERTSDHRMSAQEVHDYLEWLAVRGRKQA